MSRSLLALMVVFLLALGLDGCGGGTNGASSGGNSGSTSPGQGSVLVQHVLSPRLARGSVPAVPAAASRFVLTGFDANHERLYGPVTVDREPATYLTGVPVEVKRIRVRYLDAQGVVLLTSHVPVTVTPGGDAYVVATDLRPPGPRHEGALRPAYGSLSSPGARSQSSTAAASSGLTVQVVNDSGLQDQDVYLLLAGTGIDVSTTSTQLATSDPSSGTVTATQVSALPLASSPSTIVSTYTGQTLNLYQFTLDTITAGELLVSFQDPVHSTAGGIPDAGNSSDTDFPTRWDHLEITYPGEVDLTSINAYGIPLQLDFLDPSSGDTLSTLTYYASTPTILGALYNLDTSTMGSAFYDTSGQSGFQAAWTAPTPSLGTFARVLGPSGILSTTQQDPSPYPSFQDYLDALAGAATTFTMTGSAGAGSGALPAEYTYTGSVSSDGNGGYAVTLSGTMTTSPGPPWGAPTGKDANNDSAVLPANQTVTLNLGSGVFDYNVYAVPATAFTVSMPADLTLTGTVTPNSTTISGLTSTAGLLPYMSVSGGGLSPGTTIVSVGADSVTLNQAAPPTASSGPQSLTWGYAPLQAFVANSTYADIAGDFFAALNNGYLGGNWGTGDAYADGSATTSGQSPWYFNPPTPYPFGAARPTNDGYYNPYAAIFYNLSDAYAFVYGDRNGRPSPALEVPDNGLMRITILNDTRLDMPQVTATPSGNTTIDLSWQTVPGATGYSVTCAPPYGSPPQTTTATSLTLQNLTAGQPYEIQVQATATATPSPGASPVPITSYTLPVTATTTGTFQASTGDVTFQIACGGWSGGSYPLSLPTAWAWVINGTSYSPSPGSPNQTNATITGTAGQQNYVPMVVTDTKGNIVYQGVYAIWLAGSSASYTVASSSLSALLGTLTQAGPPGTPPYSNTSQLVLGTPVTIQPDKQFAPVVMPSPSPSPSPSP